MLTEQDFIRIERQVAQEYGIKILYEDFFVNKPEIATREM